MKISHIVTNGCSFTYGNGLAKPKEQAWPHLLANKLGVDVVNLGKPAAGNDTIFRRTYEYFYEDLVNQNNPFYVIMFSSATRKERWHNDKRQYETLSPLGNESDPGVVDYLHHYDLKHYIKQTMHYKSAVKNLFDAHNIPYLFLTSINDLHSHEIRSMRESISKQMPNHLFLQTNDINDIGDASALTKDLPRTKCMHWVLEGHIKVADYVFDHMHKNYGPLEIEPTKNYMSVEDYRNLMKEHLPFITARSGI